MAGLYKKDCAHPFYLYGSLFVGVGGGGGGQ